MKLDEFLETADPDDEKALIEANAYTETPAKQLNQRMVNERTVIGLIGMGPGEGFMLALEASEDIPARIKTWFKPSEFGIDINSKDAVGLIDTMAVNEVITEAEANILKGYGYDSVKPFARADLYQVKLSRGTATKTPLTVNDGYVVLTVSNDLIMM